MKRLIAIFVAALFVSIGVDGHAQRRPRPHASTSTKKPTKKRRARRPVRMTPALAASQEDELVLSPVLIKQLQRNLVDGGYLHGTCDGRLTPRTRRALAEFQREYHMVGTGALDRATAVALLGNEAVPTAHVAAATR
jgi:peptidoglycan hydrolase-like protein with peptidoglycan-binding domain